MRFEISPMSAADWPAVRSIYLEGIATGNATFEREAPDWDRWDAGHLPVCRLVSHAEGRPLGWAALSRVSARPVYAGVAEVSIYVAEAARGAGAGRALLTALVTEAERHGLWTLQAGIFPENRASLVLHQKAGFRVVGIRERLGALNGLWRDVVLMERRSQVVGV
ncbi:MAG TPA: GNAT family N-acetyltransferase [Bryobacteraceae bacterium]|nr:GNAT family N-acetyltransferase [Bryobacteraceae bacterium]